MTAKEISFKHLPNKFKWEVNRKEDECNDFTLIPDWIQNAMKDYARLKCKEQRHLCQKSHDEGNPKIRNAPEPEFQ